MSKVKQMNSQERRGYNSLKNWKNSRKQRIKGNFKKGIRRKIKINMKSQKLKKMYHKFKKLRKKMSRR